MTQSIQKIAIVLLLVISLPAWASNNRGYEYAKVIDAQPVIELVQVPQDRQVCRQQAVQQRVPEYRSPAPAVFGAIIGGVIGNQLSRGHGHNRRHGHHHRSRHDHGSNRAVATIAGAAIGGAIATGVQYNRYPPQYYSRNVQVCNTETSWRTEERIVAWDVSWRYKGRIYHSRMDEEPGNRIPVRVSVDPIYR